MTFDELTDARLETAELAAELRNVAATGRAAFDGLREDAARARTALDETARVTRTLSSSLRSGLSRALRSALIDGEKLSDVLRNLALDVSRQIAGRAIDGLAGQLSGALGSAFSGAFSGGVQAFARGGVIDGPTLFPMQGGLGLAGEAGAEAILPLRRGADGRLGVAGQGGNTSVSITIQTPDPEAFRRSETQIAATLARAVDRGRRNL